MHPSSFQFDSTIPSSVVGCCEAIEERIDVSQRPDSAITVSERERRKTARPRPLVENLCVAEEYRNCGVGFALLNACEEAVRSWPCQYELFAQVDDDNTLAYNFFEKSGYQFLFADPTCTRVLLDNVLSSEPVTKRMLRKLLDDGDNF